MVVGKDKAVSIDRCDLVRRADLGVCISPDMLHRGRAESGFKKLDGRVCAVRVGIEQSSCCLVKRRAVVDEEDAERLSVCIDVHVQTVEVVCAVAFVTCETLRTHFADARGPRARGARVEDRQVVIERAPGRIQKVEPVEI